jgi:cytochrome c-type biogenesis protein CcmH/NrfG
MKYCLSAAVLASAVVFAVALKCSSQDSSARTHASHFDQDGPGGRAESPENAARLEKEAAALEAEARANPENAELSVKLGFIYSRLRKIDDAQRAFENAVRLDPKKAIAYYMLGLIYEKKGFKDRAVGAWMDCLEHSGDPRMRDTAARHLHHLRAN